MALHYIAAALMQIATPAAGPVVDEEPKPMQWGAWAAWAEADRTASTSRAGQPLADTARSVLPPPPGLRAPVDAGRLLTDRPR